MTEELVIYGDVYSEPTRSLITFCKLSSIPYTYKPLSLFKQENISKELSKISPFYDLPAIVHNGYKLWQAEAIIPYLSNAFNIDNQWYPKDIKIRGQIDAYLHWHHTGTRQSINDYFRAKVLGPAIYQEQTLKYEIENEYKNKLSLWIDNFSWMVSQTGYAAITSHATIADIFAYNEVVNFPLMEAEINYFPVLKIWFEKIGKISEVHNCMKIIYAEMTDSRLDYKL